MSWAVYHGCLLDAASGETVPWEGGVQIHPLSAGLRRYFTSRVYHDVVWETVANTNFRIDWALFPELVESDVTLTNSRGVFDVSLPEYLLSLMLALVKDLPASYRAQERHVWQHRLLEPLAVTNGDGTTVVTNTATDASGNSSVCTFTVTVDRKSVV